MAFGDNYLAGNNSGGSQLSGDFVSLGTNVCTDLPCP